MTKYLASGWWKTSAEVDCSGTNCHSSVNSMPTRSGRRRRNSCSWSSRRGQAGEAETLDLAPFGGRAGVVHDDVVAIGLHREVAVDHLRDEEALGHAAVEQRPQPGPCLRVEQGLVVLLRTTAGSDLPLVAE